MKCATCKYWNAAAGAGYSKGFGVCENNRKLLEVGEEGADSNDVLVYKYSEGGCFYTGPEFGCVHHSKREGVAA